jgi:hypothetical protein
VADGKHLLPGFGAYGSLLFLNVPCGIDRRLRGRRPFLSRDIDEIDKCRNCGTYQQKQSGNRKDL